MADLVKTVLGGTWSLIVGWILPVFLMLQVITLVLLDELRGIGAVDHLLKLPWASQQVALLAVAAVVGLFLAAAQAPLYRVLEGYVLWPATLADARTRAHRTRRDRLVRQQQEEATTDRGVRAGLVYEHAARYPVLDRQFAPTALGNAIRRFETYAGDRYKLDSQLLWHHLTAAAPERAVAAVDTARANVDFFVCLLYGAAATSTLGVAVAVAEGPSARTFGAIAGGVGLALLCYRMAVLATDEWDAAVRAVVDHGRKGVAAAFGVVVPTDFDQERQMWQVINTLVRRPWAYSETKHVAQLLTRFRQGPAVGGSDPSAAGQAPTTEGQSRA